MERLEKGPSQGRNLERDRQSFAEAISADSIKEIPTDFDESASQELVENLSQTHLFILGEMHGVKENADIIYTLFKKFGFRQLALEWSPELKEVAEKFIETGELDFDAIEYSPDGRITAGHFALLKKLKDDGMLDRLICFDGGAKGPSWNERDESMAKNILAGLSDTPTLVVAGNLHTKTGSFTLDDAPDTHHPMGEHIKKQVAKVASGKIDYLKGQFHNYGTKELEDVSGGKSSEARFYKDENEVYVFELPEAHAAIVPNPNERITE